MVEVITVATWWPGNFFYRGVCNRGYIHPAYLWNPGVVPEGLKMNNYILGG